MLPITIENDVLMIPVLRGVVLGVKVYRGYCPLSLLSEISRPDVYDKVNNPHGTQRDLSPSHAKDAYDYVKTHDLAYWPEVFLCIRYRNVVIYEPLSDDYPDMGLLKINIKEIQDSSSISISRVDGNHRLFYANGAVKGYSKIDKTVSFCLAYGLDRSEEMQLFKDINDNQKKMDTSHLDSIEVRLSPEDLLKKKSPDLYIADKLGKEPDSAFFNRVFEGGKKASSTDIPLRSLRTGIEYMLSRSIQLPRLEDAEAQYRVIRNYFSATKLWLPDAWANPKDYLLLRGVGLWATCFIGAHVIDRALQNEKFDADYMLEILRSGKDWDWTKNGEFKGFSGRGGAVQISNMVTQKFHDENRLSTKDLFEKIMRNK